MLTPLTTILCLSGRVRSTSPCLPLSLPATTITGSPGARSSHRRLGSSLLRSIGLQNLRGQRDDLHEVALAQLASHGPEYARAARVVGSCQQHRRVLVEPDERPVGAPVFLVDADHDRLDDLALLDLAARLRRLDGGGDAHEFSDPALVLLVVDLETRALLQRLLVEAVRARRAHLDDDRLVHLVGD